MHERRAITGEPAERHQKAMKTVRSQVLNEYTQLTSCSHCYGSHIPPNWRKHHVRIINVIHAVIRPEAAECSNCTETMTATA